MISITIPVGPNPVYLEYLPACIESAIHQDIPPREILIVDDQAHLGAEWLEPYRHSGVDIKIMKTHWLSGVAHSFNFGVAQARNSLVLMLGSDDILQPWAVEDCVNTYRQYQDQIGYYFLDVEYSDGRGVQSLPCNAAMVTKDMWNASGGFPVASAIGAPDTMLVSILMKNPEAGHLIHVESPRGAPYWYRVHDQTATATQSDGMVHPITAVRDILTRDWRRPTWTAK